MSDFVFFIIVFVGCCVAYWIGFFVGRINGFIECDKRHNQQNTYKGGRWIVNDAFMILVIILPMVVALFIGLLIGYVMGFVDGYNRRCQEDQGKWGNFIYDSK